MNLMLWPIHVRRLHEKAQFLRTASEGMAKLDTTTTQKAVYRADAELWEIVVGACEAAMLAEGYNAEEERAAEAADAEAAS